MWVMTVKGYKVSRLPQTVFRVAAGALALVLLASCAQIPTSGSVQSGIDEVTVPRSGYLLATGPTPGADRLDIVQGFLRAMSAGAEDDYGVAREYLLDEARRVWEPTERVVVHPTSTSLEPILEENNSVHLTTAITATLDREGRYAQAPGGVQEEFTFVLERNTDNEWRIAQAPDVTLMSVANFDFLYRATPIYFASHDQKRLISELRWFPERTQVSAAAATVLAGPSTWLQEAVYPVASGSVRLSSEGVSIEDGIAIVGLSDHVLNASLEDRGVLAVAMEQTLLRIPGVHGVELRTGSAPLVMPTPLPDIDLEPTSPGVLAALGTDDAGAPVFLEYVGGVFTPREGLEMPEDPVHDYAVSLTDPDRIAFATSLGVLRVRPETETVTLLAEKSVESLSWDRWDWLWLTRAAEENPVVAITTDGEYQEINADWLNGREVTEARVARDGARILIISRDRSSTSIDLAAIIRDEQGRPQALGQPVQLGAGLKNATTAVWVDNLQIAVLADNGSAGDLTPYLVEVGGRITSLPTVEDARWLAAGKGERSLYLGSSTGRIYVRDGQTWSPIAEDVSDPHFPG